MKFFRVYEAVHIARIATELYLYTQRLEDSATIRVNDVRIITIPERMNSDEPSAELLTNNTIWSPKRSREEIE